ncbi:MAG: phosphonate metabolism transcriptional regulator PhnF [Pseudomonadota bacterium]
MTATGAEPARDTTIRRNSGVSLWRQISDRIRRLETDGELDPEGRLPTELRLAEEFGVNRHTVRSAISHLVQEGVLRTEQGRGTFFRSRPRLAYPIGRRTRFSAGLEGQASTLQMVLVESATIRADERVAEGLDIGVAAPVIWLRTIGLADGEPVSTAESWFPADRLPGIADAFRRTGSVTAALSLLGIDDYTRRATMLTATHASDDDLARLKLAPGAIVLVAVGVNVDPDGRPIQYSETRFSADRVELTIESA